MRKNIDIDQATLTKLKVISAFKGHSVKSLMERAVHFFIEQEEKERFENMTDCEKKDLGLLLLMQQADREDIVSENSVMALLED